MHHCLTCGASLEGQRRDAIYCTVACRRAAHEGRERAKLRHEGMRELAKAIDPGGDVLRALDDLRAMVPNFDAVDDYALTQGAGITSPETTS